MDSSSGIDYSVLDKLLAAGKWEKANKETKRVVLMALNSDWLQRRFTDFPCEDLRIIDQLWLKYSNGRFGFSVQKRIYESLGGTEEYNSVIWEAFGDRIGWRKNERWTRYLYIYMNFLDYPLMPDGYLPTYDIFFLESEFWFPCLVEVAESIFCSLKNCEL